MLTQLPPQHKAVPTHGRRGSALLIVMVLMAMLSLLGVLFYLFATQERLSAEYYSNAAKVEEYDFTVDQQFDLALEQIIVGPKSSYKNSALYPGRHSIIPNMLGSDLHPFNGQGVPNRGLMDGADNVYGTAPDGRRWVDFNDSPTLQAGGADRDLSQFPQPDVDYTYPDINNLFLSYDGFVVVDPTTNDVRRVIIPSFHRPQYLAADTAPYPTDWYIRHDTSGGQSWENSAYPTATGRVLLRPHPNSRFVAKPGQRQPNPAVQRFLTAASGGVGRFPFEPEQDVNGAPQIGEQGVWSNSYDSFGNAVYEYDVDNDGDGTREGVWLDVDFPALEDESGQLYVPLISATIKDADALLNLNVHGNLARVWDGSVPMDAEFAYTAGAGQDRYVSRSNLGLTPAEVNPLWALNRQPGIEGAYTAEDFFSNTPPNLQFESANREWLFMLMGRFNQTTTDLIPGRFGEVEKMYQNVLNSTSRTAAFFNPWPGPGQTDVDDNSDAQQVSGGFYGQGFIPFGRPMDYAGLGSFTTFGKYALVGPAMPSNLARWPRFNGYSTLASVQPVWSTFNNGMTASVSDTLSNDMMETIFDARRGGPVSDPRNPDKRYTDSSDSGNSGSASDDLFGPDEMRLLHLSNADFNQTTGGSSRLSRLAPFNFATDVSSFPITGGNYDTSSQRSSLRHRGKFTTLSWDRKQFNPPPYDATRAWEYNADADGDGRLEFPTAYNGLVYSLGNGGLSNPVDPFRPLLRKLLEVEPGNRDETRLQFRLSLNELLTDVNGDPLPNFNPGQIPPELVVATRPLTNHNTAAVDGSAMGGPYAYPANGAFSTAKAQEWWARRDRQLMARDIYVLLYTMCWGEDDTNAPTAYEIKNPTQDGTNPNQVNSSDPDDEDRAMMRRMAQFAVNVVDSLDRDNIFTKFEYDTNLSNGWNLDDDPYTNSSEADREVVWGVERLDLTLSETLALRAQPGTSDETRTEWVDDDGPHHFAYVELQNPGPAAVTLADGWQIEVSTGPSGSTNERQLELRDTSPVQPGEHYTIASIGQPAAASSPLPSMTHPSVMKVAPTSSVPSGDWGQDPTTWVVPGPNRVPDLELQLPAHSTLFSLSTGSALLDEANAPPDSTSPVRFRLQRLAYPGIAFDATHNPWVTVDGMEQDGTAAGQEFYEKTFDATNLAMSLSEIKSTERDQPFSFTDDIFNESSTDYPPPNANVRNSFASENSGSPASSQGFNIFQGVLDRDFASVVELFQIGTGGGTNAAKGLTAGYYFSHVLRTPVPASNQEVLPNRWHRLLEFVEVPTRTHRGIPGFANALDYPRVPGKINVNMIRHPEVLAALIDDPTVMRLMFMDDYNQNGTLDGMGGAATAPNLPDPPINEDLDSDGSIDVHTVPPLLRTDTYYNMNGSAGTGMEYWWYRFLQARDGRRVLNLSQTPQSDMANFSGFYLPGTTYSSPYRSWARVDTIGIPQIPAVESTLMRSWPTDNGATKDTHRHFFELGTAADHANRSVDPTVRNRILAKIANNVTTRSNVFVIYLSLKYFKAVENNGAIQIGEPLDTSVPVSTPDHRGFFVIDRTRAEDAWDPATQRFDFRSVIQFRQVLQ